MRLGVEVGLGQGDFVLDGEPAPPKGGHTPNFRPMSTVAKPSKRLGTEVGLGPGDIVLDGNPTLPRKGAHHPTFGPCSLSPNG